MKLKICHFADHLNGRVDGIYTHIKSIIENTDSKKYEHYFCFQGNADIEKDIFLNDVKIVLLPELTSKFPIKALIRFYKICKTINIDIIHAHFLKPYIIGGLVNILLNKKLIYNYNGHFIFNHFYSNKEKSILYFIHSIICLIGKVNLALTPSETSKKKLLQETKLFPKIIVYYNGGKIYNTLNSKRKLIDKMNSFNHFKIVYAGRLAEQKRLDIALKIIKELVFSGEKVIFYILGEGELKSQLEFQVSNYGISKNVYFVGRVEEPYKYFYYQDLFLLTSDFEGLPLVFWEAMGVGLPILSSAIDGCKEIIVLTGCGETFDNTNIQEAVIKIKYFIRNPEKLEEMGQNGITSIMQKYNVNNFGKQIDNVYLSLTNK